MNRVRFSAFALALLATAAFRAPLVAQQTVPTGAALNLDERIPVDAKVRIGTLPNGLRYYIRKNTRPEKRAELRLAINAGSILENDDQRGYAHFVEHMAFNGTTNFAKNDLVKYLQSIGVRFGADLNAYTSFDETVYILPIPTDTAKLVDQAFTILRDWANGLTFDPTEVVSERGVVREEWRLGKGAGERMFYQLLPIALKDSRYAKRLPIGTDTSIMGATRESLRPFYQDWYRPELMAVIAVGDFDVTEIENRIKAKFTDLPRRPNARPRTVSTVPNNIRPLVAIATDKEATSTDVSLYFKLPKASTTTIREYRRDLTERLYLQMLNGRLGEITQKPDAPFTGAGAGKGSFLARDVEAFSLDAGVQDGGVERGLEALLVEARRVDQFGFLQTELDRAKTNLLRSYERANAERDKSESGDYADELIRNFLEQEVIPGIEYEYKITQQLLPTIALDDVNKLASSWISDENRVVIVQAPIKDGVKVPSESELLAVFDKASKAAVVAYSESVSGDALITTMRPAGRVTSGRSIPGTGVSEWKLSNGARVLFKPTDFKADQILFSAYSDGGNSFVKDADFMSAAFSAQIVSLSGLGQFNRIDLGKKLAGKAASVGASIGEMTEGLSGQASPKDIETLFQLTYLNFTGARLDTVAFNAAKLSIVPYLQNRGVSPDEVFNDTVQVTLAQHHFRARPLTTSTFNEVSAPKAIDFFKDRFANAGDFTFVFVGALDTVALKPLVETYLASLPGTGRRDSARVVSPAAPKGVIEKTVRKGIEKKATTIISFSGACTYSPETRVAFRAMVDAFQMRLDELLREKLGGVYSPSVGGSCGRRPRQEYGLQVRFESSDENVEALSKAVFALIDTIKTQGPRAADVEKVREQIVRSREVDLKQNSYWLSGIVTREQSGEEIAGLLAPYDDLVKKITAAQIQDAAKKYFDTKNYARFVLLPEAPAPKP
jgi:zinc protease